MWIRRYTEAERTAKSTSEPASLPLPVIKVSLLIDLPKVSLRRDAKFLTDVWFSMGRQ
jgi:hypothetical protein